MYDNGTVIIAPSTFGYGPSSHAVSIARALRRQGNMAIWAVADGAAIPYLEKNQIFDAIFHARPDELPDPTEFQPNDHSVFIAVTDFARAIIAKERGLTVVVVDALYWMWRSDPMDVRIADAYLCLAFPGLKERIEKVQPPCSTLSVIPQISETQLSNISNERRGLILNFGGGTTPFGFSYDYAAALVRIAQNIVNNLEDNMLLVTCSEAARNEIEACGIRADIRSLSLEEMLYELTSRQALITLPGLSIMWDATLARIPTFVVPGISYSQHQLVKQYIQYFQGMQFFTWDDIPGYGLLSLGMDEDAGVRNATLMANRFAGDEEGILRLTNWLTSGFLQNLEIPSLQIHHPWGDFSGAEKVAEETLRLLSAQT